MSHITTTILTSSLGMRQYLPWAFYPEEFADDVAKFLEAPLPQTLEEAYEEASEFAYLMTDREWVGARGINHFASERWDVRWLQADHNNRRTLLPGGWSATVDELVETGSQTWGCYRPSLDRAKPQQPLLPFWGGETNPWAETTGDVGRTPEENRFILNTMLSFSHGEYFNPPDFDGVYCFDMRQSADDTDLLLFGIVAKY